MMSNKNKPADAEKKPENWHIPKIMPKIEHYCVQPKGCYGAAIIDPPWSEGQRGKNSKRSAESHYPLMTLDAIRAMPISSLMKRNAFIFVWFTTGTLPYIDSVIQAYGFKPVSVMIWVKEAGGRLGLGNYVRGNHEYVRIGVRGDAKVKFRGQPSVFYAPVQEHSHKPEEFHQIVRRLVGDEMAPFCEIFARRPYPGWDVWGNEVPSDFKIEGYDVPVYTDKAFGHTEEEV